MARGGARDEVMAAGELFGGQQVGLGGRAEGSGSCWGWGGALGRPWEGARAARRYGGPGGQLLRGSSGGQ
eukprot:6336255-Prymnesium_polylepis.1